MKFSVNQLWEKLGVPLPELSISLPAPVYARQELLLSFTGELKAIRFRIVPHVYPTQTITVCGLCGSSKPNRADAPELRRIPQRRRFDRVNLYACNCRLRL